MFGHACFIFFILLPMLSSWEASSECVCMLLLLLRLVAHRHWQTNIILNFIFHSNIFSAQLLLSIKPKYLHNETQTYQKIKIMVCLVETQKLSITNSTCQASCSFTSPQLQVFRLLSLRAALLVQWLSIESKLKKYIKFHYTQCQLFVMCVTPWLWQVNTLEEHGKVLHPLCVHFLWTEENGKWLF